MEPGHLPADAARAQHPAARTTTKRGEIITKNTMQIFATKH